MQGALLAWWSQNATDLPWRHTHDPYAILVSEVMLQQTQVARVIPRYRAWLERWPTVDALAAASPAEVITAWSGLGLQPPGGAAASLRRGGRGDGGFPRDPRELRGLPGSARTPRRRSRASPSARRSPRRTPTPSACSSGPSAIPTSPPPAAGHTSGTRPSSISAARSASPAGPAATICPLAPGCPSRGRTYAPLRKQSRFEGSFRQRRAELLRAIASAGSLPDAEADAEALVSLVRDGLAEVSDGHARLPE